MNDAELYLAIQRKLRLYHDARIKNDRKLAYDLSIDLLELTQELVEIACDENKKV